MQTKGSVIPEPCARQPKSSARRWLDSNGARTWLWATLALGLVWVGVVLHLPY